MRLASTIYKELRKPNIKKKQPNKNGLYKINIFLIYKEFNKTNNPVKLDDKTKQNIFSKEKIQMANKHFKN